MFSLKNSTATTIAIPFRVFCPKKNIAGDIALFRNCYLLGWEKISSQIYQTGSWLLLRVIFKISDEQPRFSCIGITPCWMRTGVWTISGSGPFSSWPLKLKLGSRQRSMVGVTHIRDFRSGLSLTRPPSRTRESGGNQA